MCLINGDVGVGLGACVSVGDHNRAEPLTANFVWRLTRRPLWVP